MLSIYQVRTEGDRVDVRLLFWEYLQWANSRLNEEYGIHFDIATMLEQDMLELDKYSPPGGCLMLAKYEGQLAGLACMRKIREDSGEIKRMYVRPAFRKKGIGKELVKAVIKQARTNGYSRVRLDSARFMKGAHALYRSFGFAEIEPYAESEIPPDLHKHWIFMELWLRTLR